MSSQGPKTEASIKESLRQGTPFFEFEGNTFSIIQPEDLESFAEAFIKPPQTFIGFPVSDQITATSIFLLKGYGDTAYQLINYHLNRTSKHGRFSVTSSFDTTDKTLDQVINQDFAGEEIIIVVNHGGAIVRGGGKTVQCDIIQNHE